MKCICILAFSFMISARIFGQGMITTIAGDGVTQYIGDGWPATAFSLAAPSGVCVDKNRNVIVADYADSRIRRITPDDTLSTIGDTSGIPGYSGDGGLAVNAKFNNPAGLCMDTAGNFYLTEEFNHIVRRIDKATRIVTTVCGTGTGGTSGDGGPATAATMNQPAGLCADNAGNIYIADKGNSRIRKVTFATGLMSTVAGGTTSGYSGDNGPATNAKLNFPRGVCADGAGNIYIADYGNNRIRRVDALTGIITTVAGTGAAGYSGDGAAASAAKLRTPNNVFMDKHGNLFISDLGNNVIRKMAPDGTIRTIAGNGSNGYSGDGGPATAATFFGPTAIFVDDSDYVYIADGGNSVIRKITPVVTAVDGLTLQSAFNIYPNPSSGIFTITTSDPAPAMICVYNVAGQKVISTETKAETFSIDLTHQPPGMYYVVIRTAYATLTKKILVNR